MLKYPIGLQSFRKIREYYFLYVDKTELIYQLLESSGYYFLSRPRRFGKSLLLSTLQEIFLGNKDLFKGLWIEDEIDWEKTKYPVIHISFSTIGYQGLGLEEAIIRKLHTIANEEYDIPLNENKQVGICFEELIKKLSKDQKVVILIDEYDKPIIDYLTELDQAKANQKTLKSFYSILKSLDSHIRFLFITGVSKFSKVSIFSDLNNLDDITINPQFSTICGITQKEVEQYFESAIIDIQNKKNESRAVVMEEIKAWYNGYSWDGAHFVYNPFSLLNFFSKKVFHNFWFATGTPTFLIDLLKERFYYKLDLVEVDQTVFESYDIENLEIRSLLFQTGYLTVKEIDEYGLFILGYPNNEVRHAMFSHLIGAFRHYTTTDSTPVVVRLTKALKKNDLEGVISVINSLFKSIPNQLFNSRSEAYYHTIIHLIFNYLGHFLESEVNTSDGRIDSVVQTQSHIYIFEFKLDRSAQEAMAQIQNKDYAAKYQQTDKTIVGLGINFSSTTKAVDGWESEVIKN